MYWLDPQNVCSVTRNSLPLWSIIMKWDVQWMRIISVGWQKRCVALAQCQWWLPMIPYFRLFLFQPKRKKSDAEPESPHPHVIVLMYLSFCIWCGLLACEYNSFTSSHSHSFSHTSKHLHSLKKTWMSSPIHMKSLSTCDDAILLKRKNSRLSARSEPQLEKWPDVREFWSRSRSRSQSQSLYLSFCFHSYPLVILILLLLPIRSRSLLLSPFSLYEASAEIFSNVREAVQEIGSVLVQCSYIF